VAARASGSACFRRSPPSDPVSGAVTLPDERRGELGETERGREKKGCFSAGKTELSLFSVFESSNLNLTCWTHVVATFGVYRPLNIFSN
jgi:hypothetical protein